MKDPKRLFETGSPLERSILDAGRREQPSPDLGRRTLAAMAAISVTGAPPPPSRVFTFPRPRVLVVGAAAIGVGALLAVAVARRPAPAPVPPPLTESVNAAPSSVDVAPPGESIVTPDTLPNAASAAEPIAATEPSVPAPSARHAAPRPVASASIAREVELLDRVKSRLAASDPAEAARTLDAYDAEFPAGTLRPEATVLRIRALLARGDRARAEKLGRRFLEQHPTGIHAKRVRALLESPDEK